MGKGLPKIYIAIHNVSSPQRLTDVAKIVFSECSPFSCLIISKPTGMAAQVGVPDVSKMAYKLGKNLLIISSLQDLSEVIDVSKVYIVHPAEGSNYISLDELSTDDKTLYVISGSDVGFTKSELALGEVVYVKPFKRSIGVVAEVALITYGLMRKLRLCQD
mgnify:CR=1 FL=1